MNPAIQTTLNNIAEANHVKIFYACESGSRGWGFPSADSDYDVRFFYLHPQEWYLAINVEKKRDTIEVPMIDGVLDICGWDLRKALQLLRKSNAPLLEWLVSPIVYLETFDIAATMRTLAHQYYSPIACFWHYLGMAGKNYRTALTGDRVKAKHYLYVLRPILAAKWLEQGLGLVPMEFEVLVNRLIDSAEFQATIKQLIAAKRQGTESDHIPRLPVVDTFIAQEFARLEHEVIIKGGRQFPMDELNALFRKSLQEIWGDV